MIKVNIVRNEKGFISSIEVKGHAGYSKAGSDIVCAAASVTAYTTAGALGELAGLEDCYSEKEGFMLIKVPQDLKGEREKTAQTILETGVIGFKQIELSYGDYISVFDKEV